MKKIIKLSYLLLALSGTLILVQCKTESKQKDTVTAEAEEAVQNKVTITKSKYGTTPDSTSVFKYTLKNEEGMELDVITYGGIITSWKAPDKNGVYKDVVLGYDSLSQYIKSNPYFGAVIGRYGNRIAKGKLKIGENEYTLATNNGLNHLHGGIKGFDKVVWDAKEIISDSAASLQLSYLSKDMEEGYPGNLKTAVTYTLNNNNELEVLYEAETDKATIVNLTQHTYFNLSADFSKPILDHEIMINADKFLPVDETLIPTGELLTVEGTPFDFRTLKSIGKEIEVDNDQIKKGLGYDHCWVLNDQDKGFRLAATVYHPETGRLLEIFTTEPGIQFYSGNFLDGTLPAKNGGTYAKRTGFCLETQHYPDSPNQTAFPSVILNPGEKYSTKTTFKFSAK
ncbi:aldose epimerase family protein [Abyssalbus ytuae]|uniref:Aldose 1-epimerase n=1 Tax=Abyssalbus ytuae TaxID=2926907 RepID=A0A9E6ZTN9_9FLAO|nr:aldose epimerase family protein [Abyssalbus ytuae]UOB16501.1 galactose mutarotase [Abyssalbus ytuae]